MFSREAQLSLTPFRLFLAALTHLPLLFLNTLPFYNQQTIINQSNTHVTHHIITTGPPVHSQAYRLSPDKLFVARNKFEYMLQLGIIHPSSSPWSSPLYMVPKKNDDWRP